MATYSSVVFTLLAEPVDSDDAGELEATNCSLCGVAVIELFAKNVPMVRPAQCLCDRIYCRNCLRKSWQIDRAIDGQHSNVLFSDGFDCLECGKIGGPYPDLIDLSNPALSDDKTAYTVDYFELPEGYVHMSWEKFIITEISVGESQDEVTHMIYRFIYSQKGYEISVDDFCGALTMELENAGIYQSAISELEQQIRKSALESMRHYRHAAKRDRKRFAEELSSSIRYANNRTVPDAQDADTTTNNEENAASFGQNDTRNTDQTDSVHGNQNDAFNDNHDDNITVTSNHNVTASATAFSSAQDTTVASPSKREIMTRKKSALTSGAQTATSQSNKVTYKYRGAHYEVDANTKPEWLAQQKSSKKP